MEKNMIMAVNNPTMQVSVSSTDFSATDLETRLPFHFGNVEITEMPKVFLRIKAEINGTTQEGIAMGGLIPGWFYKDPSMNLKDGLQNMVETFRSAADRACTLEPQSSVFSFWKSLYKSQREWADSTDHPPLLWTYGVSLIEQAVIDAACRKKNISFETAVRHNTLGLDLGSIYSELRGYEPADLLPDEPLRSTAIRHTVGLDDPLTDADRDPSKQLEDGLPQSLMDYIRRDGVNHFKIKLSADPEFDANRLARITHLLNEQGVDEYLCTMDANEGYDSARTFKRKWETLATNPELSPLLDRLAYIEQPLARDDAFTIETKEVFVEWNDAPPIIIDESDGHIDSAGTALEYGYAGTSHKNCKGVFKGIVNACLIAHRNRTDTTQQYVLSAEDLTTTGPIESLQDFAVTATIGAEHVERNGHHYFAGLDAFPEEIQERILETHSDLYHRHEDGFAALAITEGNVDLSSVVDAPFGVGIEFDASQFTPLDDWLKNL